MQRFAQISLSKDSGVFLSESHAQGLSLLELQGRGLAFAVFSGSISSGGAGILAVLTAQNWQPRVHVSPAQRLLSGAQQHALMSPFLSVTSDFWRSHAASTSLLHMMLLCRSPNLQAWAGGETVYLRA